MMMNGKGFGVLSDDVVLLSLEISSGKAENYAAKSLCLADSARWLNPRSTQQPPPNLEREKLRDSESFLIYSSYL